MKKITLSVLMILLVLVAKSQNCQFTYQQTPGTTQVSFYPDTTWTNNNYHPHWNYNDGSPDDSTFAPIHTFNNVNYAVVCCEMHDNNDDSLICVSCDTILLNVNCNFTLSQTSNNTIIVTSIAGPNQFNVWDMGDGSAPLNGNTIMYIYSAPGFYNVCLTVIDTLTMLPLCSSICQQVVVQSSSPCNFTVAQNSSFDFTFTSGFPPPVSVTWDFGDGTIDSNLISISHTYNSQGPFVVTMNSVDSNGTPCQYRDTIHAGGIMGSCIFSIAPVPQTLNTYNFFPQINGPFVNISWDFGDGNTFVDTFSTPLQQAPATHTYSTSGVYTVCMKVSDATGIICTSCFPVQVNSTINCNFITTVNTFNNLNLGFAVNVSGSNYSVSWDFGDNTSDIGDSVFHTYALGGVYQVCVTIAQNGAAICSSCQWITVGNNSTTCTIYSWDSIPPYSKNFYYPNTPLPGSTINWVFGDGSIGTGQFVNHFYQGPGTYTVCVIERDSANNPLCNTCINVLVGNGPVICNASFLSASLGLTAYFIDLSVSPLNATSYYWDFGDGSTSTTRFPQHIYSSPGTNTVCLTITSGNCTDQFCSTITVDTAINPGIGCQAFFAIVQLATYQVTVVNLSGGVNLDFSWDFGDGSTDTLPYPSHYYSTTGFYNLCLTVTDGNGCTSTYCDTIEVDSLGYIYRGMAGFTLNVFSPMQVTAGVNEIDPVKTFKAFPNPVSNELHVISEIEKIDAYRILSIQGAEINSGRLSGTENIINMQKLSPGSYLLEITFSDGSRNYQTIIKN